MYFKKQKELEIETFELVAQTMHNLEIIAETRGVSLRALCEAIVEEVELVDEQTGITLIAATELLLTIEDKQ